MSETSDGGGQGGGAWAAVRRWLGGLRDRVAGMLQVRWLRLLGVLAALAVLAVALRILPLPPVWPFLTTGRVYVETPEVYTRERLVNDRYRQDFWLKSQLDRLDSGQSLVRERRFVAVGAGADAGAAPDADLTLPFQEDFFLRAAARDKIRQLILENLLDDRHDLTGNSIYGLKFDTAVIPGRNTYARPYVVVEITIDPFQPDSPEAGTGATAPGDFDPASFLAVPRDDTGVYAGTPFFDAARQFRRWKEDLESRVNRYLEASQTQGQCMVRPPEPETLVGGEGDKLQPWQGDAGQTLAAASAADGPAEDATPAAALRRQQEALVRRALLQVMGIQPREVSIPDLKQSTFRVLLPAPWDRFFYMQIGGISDGETAGRSDLFIELRSSTLTLHLADREAWQTYEASRKDGQSGMYWGQRFVQVDDPAAEGGTDARFLIVEGAETGGAGGDWLTRRTLQYDWEFARALNRQELSRLRQRGNEATCHLPADPVTGGSGCALRSERYQIDASLYNFIKGISEIDAYSYAVFPRGDVEGVLSSFAASAGARLPELAADLGLEAMLQSQTAGAEPVVVNFAGGDLADGPDEAPQAPYQDVIDFGWAFVKQGRQQAKQVSQLVLVSVPAYIDRLELDVTTGWLDGDARPIAGTRRRETMDVVLPPDYEALDTLVIGGTKSQGPVIDESQFDEACGEIRVRACARADLLIPGERLWRSTSVTLGGQLADRITVMPDMRGIVATFDPVVAPLDPDNPRESLVVWTSESSAQLNSPVQIDYPGDCQPD